MSKLRALVILTTWTCMALTCRAAAPPERQVAITIDDLPAGNAYNMSAADITQMTTKLLAALQPAEHSNCWFRKREKAVSHGQKWMNEMGKALDMWLDAGMELKVIILSVILR